MYTLNFLKITDFDRKKFLIFVIAIQLSYIGLEFYEFLGLKIPLIKEVVSIIFLVFLPGILILRALRIHTKSTLNNFLLTVGLSISFVMIIGLFNNFFLYFLGIKNPLSSFYLIISLESSLIFLTIYSYIFHNNYNNSEKIKINFLFSKESFLIMLIPIISIFGTYLMNKYSINYLLILLIILIGLVVFIFTYFDLNKEIYPLAIFTISLAILFHKSLLSPYIWGWDIQLEYYIASNVIKNSYWVSSIAYNANGMLSVGILPVIMSKLTNINLVWIYKIIYPFFYSLVPLALYSIFKEQTNKKIAFLSAFLYLSLLTFHTEILTITKQIIAELFLVLIVLLLINNDIKQVQKSILLLLFSFSLITSHYGLSYIFLIILMIGLIFLNLFSRIIKKEKNIFEKENNEHFLLKFSFILLFLVFALSWYMYVSGSSILNSIVNIGDNIFSNIFNMMDPIKSQGLNLIVTEQNSILKTFHKSLYLLCQLFISIGLVSILFKKNRGRFKQEYLVFSLISFFLLISGIIIPYLSSQLNTSRLFHLGLIFLAPFCTIGILAVLKVMSKYLKSSSLNNKIINLVAILFIVILIFDTGLIYEFSNEEITSSALSNNFDFPKFNEKEVIAAKWLKSEKAPGIIYADKYRIYLIVSLNYPESRTIPFYSDLIKTDSYIFLGTYNIKSSGFLVTETSGANIVTDQKILNLNEILLQDAEIYDNGGSIIYKKI